MEHKKKMIVAEELPLKKEVIAHRLPLMSRVCEQTKVSGGVTGKIYLVEIKIFLKTMEVFTMVGSIDDNSIVRFDNWKDTNNWIENN